MESEAGIVRDNGKFISHSSLRLRRKTKTPSLQTRVSGEKMHRLEQNKQNILYERNGKECCKQQRPKRVAEKCPYRPNRQPGNVYERN
jgi:hypothetical protein